MTMIHTRTLKNIQSHKKVRYLAYCQIKVNFLSFYFEQIMWRCLWFIELLTFDKLNCYFPSILNAPFVDFEHFLYPTSHLEQSIVNNVYVSVRHLNRICVFVWMYSLKRYVSFTIDLNSIPCCFFCLTVSNWNRHWFIHLNWSIQHDWL